MRFHEAVVHIRLEPVIGIDKADKLALRRIYSDIARRRDTAVLLMYDFYAAVPLCPLVAHGGAIIRRAVINENYFKILYV